MERLKTLKSLLDMTSEAERLVSDLAHTDRFKSLIGAIRGKAQGECKRLRRDHGQQGSFNPASAPGVCGFDLFSTSAAGSGSATHSDKMVLFGSPHLLMLSGVGPASRLQAHGIKAVADRAGDHDLAEGGGSLAGREAANL